jgi:NTP pyrophosphatase (non-canonical NTP hydrolase)
VRRKEHEQTLERIAAATTETEVTELVEAINVRIRYVNTYATSGPPSTLMPLDLPKVLERWRESHPAD